VIDIRKGKGDLMEFKNLDDLFKHIQGDIDKVLANKVATTVKEHISDEVVNTVYSAGTPLFYDRRGEGNYVGTGSLRDPEEMEVDVNNGVLTVEDNADFKDPSGRMYGTSLAETIEYGTSKTAWWNEERPFISNAETKLFQDKDHVKAMKDGLKRLNYKVD
jgi:hypothetical protein